MSYSNSDTLRRANDSIKKHTLLSMGVAIVPVPLVDFVGVVALQLEMTHELCNLYQQDYYKDESRAILSALAGSALARLGSSLVKFIPGVGSIIGGATSAILSGASTYASGEVLKNHFENGGNLLNLDVEDFKVFYQEHFEKGKQLAKQWREQTDENEEFSTPTPPPPPKQSFQSSRDLGSQIEKLKALADLKEAGILTEEEFLKMKRKIMGEG